MRSRISDNAAWGHWGLRVCLLLFMLVAGHSSLVIAAEKWPGVDESVVEKYANEQGRAAHEPLINTDQGDLLLFVFLIAGAIGGFAAGYYWRVLITEKPQPPAGERHRASR